MAQSFKELLRQSEEFNKKFASDIKNTGGFQEEKDDRIWYPAVDAAGNGVSVIRFLPPPPGEDQAYVRTWSHFFKGPTGLWYNELSLTTIGQPDPVSEYNNKLWDSGIESNKKIASAQKRKTNFYTNVYIVNDTLNPENNGKVKIFRFGPVIFDFIKNKMVPEFDDQQPLPVFDLLRGANFRIRIRKDEHGYRKYDRSEFDMASPLLDGDEDKLAEIWNQEHSLQAFRDLKLFKSYDELKARLNKVLGLEADGSQNVSAREVLKEAPPAPAKEAAPAQLPTAESTNDDDDDDENLDYFAKLARED